MLEKYQGNYVTAESANNYIDINAIVSGCENLANAGAGFSSISEKIYYAGDNCDANALSIGGDTLLDFIYEQGKLVEEINPSITKLANEIINRAYDAYNRIQEQLNEQAYNSECEYVNQLNNNR